MKVAAVYLVGWPLLWLGHLVSIPMRYWNWAGNLYPVYHALMQGSLRIDDWAGGNRLWDRVADDLRATDHDEHEDLRGP